MNLNELIEELKSMDDWKGREYAVEDSIEQLSELTKAYQQEYPMRSLASLFLSALYPDDEIESYAIKFSDGTYECMNVNHPDQLTGEG